MSFIYFVNTKEKLVSDKVLEANGLECFKGRVGDQTETTAFGGGLVFNVRGKDDNTDPRIYEDRQTWETFQHDEEHSFKVGYEKKPEPEEFLKDDYLDGHSVVLDDQNEWIIPLAKKMPDGDSALPKKIKEVRKGEIVEIIFNRYVELSRLADDVWGDLEEEDAAKRRFSWDNGLEDIYSECKYLLSINYDLEWFEFSVLELITKPNSVAIFYSLVDYYTLTEFNSDEKKKEDLETEQPTT